jgi:hypothetical protein
VLRIVKKKTLDLSAKLIEALQEQINQLEQMVSLQKESISTLKQHLAVVEQLAPKNERDDAGPDRRLNCEKAHHFKCRDAIIQQGCDTHWN